MVCHGLLVGLPVFEIILIHPEKIAAVVLDIERIFGHWKRSQGYRIVRYLGLVKNQLELTLKAVTYNLRRLVSRAAA